jgi:hypothetical protein
MTIDPHALLPLDVARQIEHTVGLCRSVRGHLEHGPFARTRHRLRRQLAKLAARLEAIQLAALSGPLDGATEALVLETLRGLDPRLEHVLYHVLDKEPLKALRRDVRRIRRELAAAQAELLPAA